MFSGFEAFLSVEIREGVNVNPCIYILLFHLTSMVENIIPSYWHFQSNHFGDKINGLFSDSILNCV